MSNKKQQCPMDIKYYKKSKHLHIIVRDVDDNAHLSIGITHSPKSGHHNNILLTRNVEVSDNKNSYILRRPIVDYKNSYKKSNKNISIPIDDIPKIKKVATKKPQDMRKKK